MQSHKFCAFIAASKISVTSKLERLAYSRGWEATASQCILAHPQAHHTTLCTTLGSALWDWGLMSPEEAVLLLSNSSQSFFVQELCITPLALPSVHQSTSDTSSLHIALTSTYLWHHKTVQGHPASALIATSCTHVRLEPLTHKLGLLIWEAAQCLLTDLLPAPPVSDISTLLQGTAQQLTKQGVTAEAPKPEQSRQKKWQLLSFL